MKNNLRAVIFFAFMLGFAVNVLPEESMKLSESDSGKTVEINVGDKLEIILDGNPTTGFIWEVSSLDSKFLGQGEEKFAPSSNNMGSGGLEIKSFQAVAPGTSQLSLIYHRPFEPNNPPLRSFTITVDIKSVTKSRQHHAR